MENEEQKEVFSPKSLIARYFLHGIAFSALLLILGVAWAVIVVFLVAFGSIIGLILGFVLLFFIAGGLNVFLTESIWHVSIVHEWKRVILQGLTLFIIMAIAHIPYFITVYFVPDLVTFVVFFLVYCFVDGFIARKTALVWKVERHYDGLSSDAE